MLNEPIEALSLDDDAPESAQISQPESRPSNLVTLAVTPDDHEPEGGERLPALALAYVLGVFGVGLLAIAFFAPQIDTTDVGGLLALAVLAMAFDRVKVPIYGNTAVSVGMVSDFAIAFLFGAPGAALISPFAAMSGDLGSGAWYKRLFNLGSVIIVNVTVASLIHALMGLVGPGLPTNAWLIPIGLLAVVVYYLMNISLLTIAVSLSTKTSVLAVWREKFEWLLPHYVVFGMLGLALAFAYDAIGIFGLLAFVAPPVMMRFSLKQYVDKTAQNVDELKKSNRELQKANRDVLSMADQLRETYDGTLEALVSALDARDRETKGHSIRVAKYMMEIAYHMDIAPGTDEWIDMQRGGLLHDIGKIGVSDSILHKPGPLTEDEWVDMRRHPKIGHDMIKDIGFLSGAAVIVLAHHERFDGKGYPKGLATDDIPIGSRIFVLADTFDAMTSDRPYRAALSVEASREEIINCSGTQFDPRCVQAFLMAFDKIVEIRFTNRDEQTEHHAAAAPRTAAA